MIDCDAVSALLILDDLKSSIDNDEEEVEHAVSAALL
jgi:hypothetical protein